MQNVRQQELLALLGQHPGLPTQKICQLMQLTRARVNQLMQPLLKSGLVKRQGYARATVYQITDKRSFEQICRENWGLWQRVRELKKELENRKLIERAKEILIAQFDILPTDAYRKMQEQSMHSGKPLRQIAEGILSAYEL